MIYPMRGNIQNIERTHTAQHQKNKQSHKKNPTSGCVSNLDTLWFWVCVQENRTHRCSLEHTHKNTHSAELHTGNHHVQQEPDVNCAQLSDDRAQCDHEACHGDAVGSQRDRTHFPRWLLEEGEQRGWSSCRNVLTLGALVREVYWKEERMSSKVNISIALTGCEPSLAQEHCLHPLQRKKHPACILFIKPKLKVLGKWTF